MTYSTQEYDSAESTLEKYRDRAIEVYKILDPSQRLIIDDDCDFHFSYMPFKFKGDDKIEKYVVLTIISEEYDEISREVWFPFALLNEDEGMIPSRVKITWDKKNYVYGGGGCWKMIAKFKKED